MQILWLNAGLLLPLDKGGKLRTWHLMRHLARRHEITYLSFADPDASEEERLGMLAACRRLETIPRRANIPTLRRMPVSKHSHSATMPCFFITAANSSILSTGLSNNIGGHAQSLFDLSFK